jgi:hypothetical protein
MIVLAFCNWCLQIFFMCNKTINSLFMQRDSLRIFYESLYEQIPTSDMAATW